MPGTMLFAAVHESGRDTLRTFPGAIVIGCGPQSEGGNMRRRELVKLRGGAARRVVRTAVP